MEFYAMYLISVYFDEKTNKMLNKFINLVAEDSGNYFMVDNQVPPHMTISSIEARGADVLMDGFMAVQGTLQAGKIQFVTVGQLFPYVIYAAPVMNEYLWGLSQAVYAGVKDIEETHVSRYYVPMSWLPHVTIGKTLSKEQMMRAFEVMQDNFVPFSATVTEIALSRVNPHEDIVRCRLVGEVG